MRILLVEDDHVLGADFASAITGRHPNISIEAIQTERELHEALPVLRESPPDLIILDVMLPWDYPRPDMTLPPEHDSPDAFRWAGIRIYERLQADGLLASVPVIFHSVFDADTLKAHLGQRPPHVLVVPKSSVSVHDILVTLRSLVPSIDYSKPEPKNWWHCLFDALELKPGAFGFRVDLKKFPVKKKG